MSGPMTLTGLVRHAERFGVELVYEMGDHLAAAERAVLADRLRELDPGWRPPKAAVAPGPARRASSMPTPDLSPGPALSVSTCAHCGGPFQARRSTGRYCKPACRLAAHRSRRTEP